ncbi:MULTISPECIES: hypothetical protein [Pseudomonas]|uniref:hypothetical protein n=1 Tax=Pseudomonas TaxID=286 RepID=UPI001FF4E63A|nr:MULTISPECIES: hypothetical protein [Pseudomonas]
MSKSTRAPKPAATDQTLKTISSLAEIKADTIIKIIPTADLQFYLYAYAPTGEQIFITSHSTPPPRSLWTLHLQVVGESAFYHIRSYPDSHLYMTYVASQEKVFLRTYSGNDDQKWLFLIADVADGRGIFNICNIVQDKSYLSVRLPLTNGSPILTKYDFSDFTQRFILQSEGETP